MRVIRIEASLKLSQFSREQAAYVFFSKGKKSGNENGKFYPLWPPHRKSARINARKVVSTLVRPSGHFVIIWPGS